MADFHGGAEWDDVPDDEHHVDEGDISADTRKLVLTRDNYRCRCCGDEDLQSLTLHHVLYRSQGGGHSPDNLVTICWNCHRKVHAKILDVRRLLTPLGPVWFFKDRTHWRQDPTIRNAPR